MKAKTYKLSISKNRKNPKQGNIKFEGDLTVKNINEITETISKNIKNFEQLTINVNNVENLDITFIQMLLAIKKSYQLLKINSDIPAHVSGIIKNSGLNDIFKTNIIAN